MKRVIAIVALPGLVLWGAITGIGGEKDGPHMTGQNYCETGSIPLVGPVVIPGQNCGEVTVTINVIDETGFDTCVKENLTYFTCKVEVSATASATNWLEPGMVHLRVFSSGVFDQGSCSDTEGGFWTIGGTAGPISVACSYTTRFERGALPPTTIRAQAEGTFTPTGRQSRTLEPEVTDSHSAPAPSGPTATLWEHANFLGGSISFHNSIPNFAGYSYENVPLSVNDSVSSLKVREDCTVTLYVNSDYEPKPGYTFRGQGGGAGPDYFDYPYVGDALNDKASSMLEVFCSWG